MSEPTALAELLRWYVEMGADEAIAEMPRDRLEAPSPPRTETVATPPLALPDEPAAARIAPSARPATARTLAELEQAVAAFEGCALKRTATNTVFADGVPGAPLMVIGEAPGADEDRLGKPFVGRAGQMLDRMLAAIGFDRRRNAYITNVLFWRPPGNRKPTAEEIAACLPFVWRHIALLAPKAILICGGTAASALLGRADGITRLRGRWFELEIPGLDRRVPSLATFHPSFLLRSPSQKGEAWKDLLSLQSNLNDIQ